MNNICFLSRKFHIVSFLILFLIFSFTNLIAFFLCLILYFLIFFLFRTGKDELVEFTKNDNYIDDFVYSPIFGKVIEVNSTKVKNMIKIKISCISLKHSWSLSSPTDFIIKYIDYFQAHKKIEISGQSISLCIKTRLFKPFIMIGTGDRIYSRAMFGYMPFGGIMEIELPTNYEILVKIDDRLERAKTVVAKL